MKRHIRAALAALVLFSAPSLRAETLDINHASAEEIAAALHGVGIRKARAIVAWREAHGPFASLEALTQVKGIGPATIEKNRARIRLGTPEKGSAGPSEP